jgi:hypothetical protein
MSPRRARAFSLLEVVAVVLILGLIFLVMGGVFRQIARDTSSAQTTESTRRGLLLVDRLARDLESATLVKKPEAVDPLAHPWLFFADGRGAAAGADRLKFDVRGARGDAEHATDLSVVAYWVERDETGDLSLYRWSAPTLPESLDRGFPARDDPGVQRVASGLTRFGVRFDDADGAVATSWDSTPLERSSQLPSAAEIAVALRDDTAPEGERAFSRRVAIAMPTLDLEKALAKDDGKGDQDDEDDKDDDACTTVGVCQARNAAMFASLIAQAPDPASVQAALDANRNQCWTDFAVNLPISIDVDCE